MSDLLELFAVELADISLDCFSAGWHSAEGESDCGYCSSVQKSLPNHRILYAVQQVVERLPVIFFGDGFPYRFYLWPV